MVGDSYPGKSAALRLAAKALDMTGDDTPATKDATLTATRPRLWWMPRPWTATAK